MMAAPGSRPLPDVLCLSHLRWNFVFQRPQHLMTRCAREGRVFFLEEPVFRPGIEPCLQIDRSAPVTVVVPQLPERLDTSACQAVQRRLLDRLIRSENIA